MGEGEDIEIESWMPASKKEERREEMEEKYPLGKDGSLSLLPGLLRRVRKQTDGPEVLTGHEEKKRKRINGEGRTPKGGGDGKQVTEGKEESYF